MYEVNDRLLKIVNELGLDLIFTDMDRSGMYFADEKAIILSNKLIEDNSEFEISHELGHCIKKHEDYAAYYNATSSSRNKLEREANEIAIQILLEVYLNEYDMEKEELNVVKFMEYYKISSHLEDCVKESMLNFG